MSSGMLSTSKVLHLAVLIAWKGPPSSSQLLNNQQLHVGKREWQSALKMCSSHGPRHVSLCVHVACTTADIHAGQDWGGTWQAFLGPNQSVPAKLKLYPVPRYAG